MKRCAWLALAASALGAFSAGAVTPTPPAASPGGLQAIFDSAQRQLDGRLARVDEAVLLPCAARALSRGARVRLILSAHIKANRLAAPRLRALGLQVRWGLDDEAPYLVADGIRLLQDGLATTAASADAPPLAAAVLEDAERCAGLSRRFGKAWAALSPELPRRIVLKDELEALPDPRETEPRLQTKRKKNGT